ncbi:hypothetical protein [Streptomyces sp. SID3343]|uniref:hypothetical protein n=1 Tax=Streptomyces sp. SID3343 TaxID=2690260 RepID=UPI00136CBF88|nr:hypothetical protein [Streptomyces sp. SID3343]MYV97899.1 hypothetical protein [Streptomyces sp. SID3343]
MGCPELVTRAGRRCAITIAAVGIVAAAGALDTASSRPPTPERSSAAPATAGPLDERAAPSAYSLRTEGGPRSVRVARVVTGTMLLTGLVLTALGAIGMRGPELIRRKVRVQVSHLAGATRYRWSPPGGLRPNLPANPGTGPPGA